MKKFKLFIGNEWIDAENGKTFLTSNPCTGKPIAEMAYASKADTQKAICSAFSTAQDELVSSKTRVEFDGSYKPHSDEFLAIAHFLVLLLNFFCTLANQVIGTQDYICQHSGTAVCVRRQFHAGEQDVYRCFQCRQGVP